MKEFEELIKKEKNIGRMDKNYQKDKDREWQQQGLYIQEMKYSYWIIVLVIQIM